MAILHRNRNFSALTPRYVERFRCIGARCEDTCCAGWPVHIDKKTYKAYRGLTHTALKPMMSLLKRVDNSLNPEMYALLPLAGPQGHCRALQDGMCSIQANVGASYLSGTCDSYPRMNRYVNNQVEQSLTLSCPEAARQALLAEDAFDFVETPISIRESTLYAVSVYRGMTPGTLSELRIFAMNLMRTRELPLWQRLALLGTFCEALDRSNTDDEALALIDEFTSSIEDGSMLGALAPVQPNHEAQAMVFATLWASKGFGSPSPHQQAQIARIAAGLGGDNRGVVSGAGLVAAYRRGLGRLDEALSETPWLLDHFLLNEMFALQFPIGAASAYESFLRLVARFGLLRLLLAAQCNADQAIPPASILVATVALQARRFQHDAKFAEEVNQALHDSGWASLDRVFTLLRT